METSALTVIEDNIRSIAGASVLARTLIDILRREARAIASMAFEAPTGFIEAKDRLIAAYSAKVTEVSKIPEVPETLGALTELRMLNAEVLVSARRNAAQLEGAMEGSRQLLASMAQSARPAACLSPVAGHC